MNAEGVAGEAGGAVDAGMSTGAVDVENLPVHMVFVAGEREIPLRELQALAPGYVFDLGQPVDGHVEIRANGRTVGTGELVDVDGRVGVRVLSLVPATAR